jgi:NitT/TauT family transport system ATP-binding protein
VKKKPKPVLILRDVAKIFSTSDGKPFPALEGVDISINESEFVTIIGPSGCGKTTLLNVIAGLIEPTRGEVLVKGEPINGADRDRGMVFQQDSIFPWRTVLKNAEFGLEMKGMPKEKRSKLAMEALRRVDLENFAGFFPKELSGGMKKRVALATVLANEPEVLLMDEPFGSLDYPTKIELQKQLLEIWGREPLTVVFVTHDIEEAVFLADKIIVMGKGVVLDIVPVLLARPRTDDVRTSIEMQRLKQHLWQYIA